VGLTHTAFVTESTIHELAHAAKAGLLEERRRYGHGAAGL
jgi:CO/xanthine dehydrogenase Mo-binding subunit